MRNRFNDRLARPIASRMPRERDRKGGLSGRPRRTPDEMKALREAVLQCKAQSFSREEAVAWLASRGHRIAPDRYTKIAHSLSKDAKAVLAQMGAEERERHATAIANIDLMKAELWHSYHRVRMAPKPDSPEAKGLNARELAAWDRAAVAERTRVLKAIAELEPLSALFTEAARMRTELDASEAPIEAAAVARRKAEEQARRRQRLPHPKPAEPEPAKPTEQAAGPKKRPPPFFISDPDRPGLMKVREENLGAEGA